MNGRTDDTADFPPCPDRKVWAGFRSGLVPPESVRVLAGHLDRCRSCQGILETIPDTGDDLVAGLRAVPPPNPFEAEPECRDAVDRIRALGQPGGPAPVVNQPIPGRIGEYRVLELIGRGGMGAVYRAVHDRLGREVAMKVLPPERAADVVAAARFHREIAALGRLDHPNVVRAVDAGEADGVAYLIMDLVRGADVGRVVRACGPLPVPDACEVARQAAVGLQHLAAHGLVHRDVKPSNLLLSCGGEVKIVDLGLALAVPGSGAGGGPASSGQVVGTYDYLAPEQADHPRRVDARADVYSLGCTLYHLLTGEPPYPEPRYSTIRGKVLAHATAPIPDVRAARPDLPVGLSAVVGRMLAKDPADRFATPAEVEAALAPYCAGHDLFLLLAKISPGVDHPTPAPIHRPRVGTTHLPETSSPSRTVATRRRRAGRVAAAVSVLAVVAVGGGLVAEARLRDRSGSGAAARAANDAPASPEAAGEAPQAPAAQDRPGKDGAKPDVYPVALVGFEERGAAKDIGPRVADLVFARLAARPGLLLVDRADLKKVLDEQALALAGAVQPEGAARVGRLTGARLLVTGSVLQVDRKVYLIAKVIAVETGVVAGVSAEGVATDDLGGLAATLADRIAEKVATDAGRLAPRPAPPIDRAAALAKKLGKGHRPVVSVSVAERHIGSPATDPAAQTEVTRFCKETGFEVVDPAEGGQGKADVLITGEGFSEVAGRTGGLVSVRARVELKAVDRRTGRVLAADRQTALVVDLAEQVAAKQALQDAASALAERVLPRLVTADKK